MKRTVFFQQNEILSKENPQTQP